MVEQDAWAFVQLPFNDSEGIGRGYCGACEDDDAEFFIDGLTPEIIADWEEYREGNGLTSLREADDAFLTEARGQLAEFDIRRDRLAAEVAAWEVELRARPTPAGLVQADREGYE
jgi:hypothetical protein